MADGKKEIWTEADKPPSTWGGVKSFSPEMDQDAPGKATLNFGPTIIRVVSADVETVKNVTTLLTMVHQITGDSFDVTKFVVALNGK